MDFGLSGQVAIVTASGQGIGRAIAEVLASQGVRVVIADLNQETSAEVVRGIIDKGGEAFSIQVDISKAADVSRMVTATLERWQTIDILINNAGIGSSYMVIDMPEEAWRKTLDVNLTGTFLCCQAVLPAMRRIGRGKIVNISSQAAKRISADCGAEYTASKEGLLGFTRHLAYEAAPYGINVNAICPGLVATPALLESQKLGLLPPSGESAKKVPMGRLATPEDIAKAVLFLVSDLSAFVCGQALDVDGGGLLGWTDTETYETAKSAYYRGKAASRGDGRPG